MLNLHMVDKHSKDYLNCPNVFLPKCDNEKVLILDVDETLIHTIDERDPPSMKGSFELFIPEYEGSSNNIQIKVNVRPYLMESLM
jgi:TFIIF-interacting CTD phosphatase-like protein